MTLVVSICICHFVVSAIVVIYLKHAHHERIINVRNWQNKGSDWEDVVNSHARSALDSANDGHKKSMLFIGSSVTYGFPYAADLTFSTWIASRFPQYQVSNLSIVGVGMDAITDFATCSLIKPHVPDLLIVEIPLVNSTSSIRPTSDLGKRTCARSPAMEWGFWGLVLPRPRGSGWVPLLWEEVVHVDHDRQLNVIPLPSDYFADEKRFSEIEVKYLNVLHRYLNDVSTMGKKVMVFVSPVYTPGIEMAGGDRKSVEHQIALSYAICKSHGGVICLDASEFSIQRNIYKNLTHFNPQGHQEFGRWLEIKIRQNI